MELITMQLATITLTLLALWQVRAFTGRRSVIREELATTGAAVITGGLLCKSILLSAGTKTDLSHNLAYPIIAAGFILLMYGFIGWDRMNLQQIGWGKPVSVIIVIEACIVALAYSGSVWWHYLAVGVVLICMILMDLLMLGYALRQRFYLAVPFLILHIVANCIMALIDLNGQTDARVIQGIVLSTTTSALLFYINTRLINRHTHRGRLQIV